MSGQPARVLEIISGFSTQYPLGGIENYVMELCQAFDQSLVAPTVVGMWNYGSEVEAQWIAALNAKGIATISGVQWNAEQPYQSFWKSFKKLEHDLQGQSFDIIHSHTQFGDVAALLLKQRIHAKALVRTIHNEYEWKKKPLRRVLLTSLLLPLFFDLEIGISQAVADKLNRRLVSRLFRRDSISIHNAIDLKKFEKIDADREAVLLRLGLDHPRGPVIGTVGRMVEQKGLTYLVRAVPLVSQQFPEAVFIIVGSGELEASLRAQSAQLGVEDHVLFTGHRLDVPEI
ncbi:MAG TPA: glycosyltransferase family 4 protein, partial [Anaerolineaceae bacterium]|nr:glycosyltransferase family 4 protein [Anaerolineaceae bacterium]